MNLRLDLPGLVNAQPHLWAALLGAHPNRSPINEPQLQLHIGVNRRLIMDPKV